MSPKSIIPKALQKGDTIAFISPSARLNTVLPLSLDRATAHVQSLGYQVKVIFNNATTKTFHESVLLRCEEIHNAFRNPAIKAIICTIGGTTANELLRHLDFTLIKSHTKTFCGYSDITLLHYAIFTQTGLQTFYGPGAIAELGTYPEPMPFTTSHFQHVLCPEIAGKVIGPVPRPLGYAKKLPEFLLSDPASETPQTLSPSPPWLWIRGGCATGRIFGGCLTSLFRLTGTKFWASHRGRILFVENPMGDKVTDALSLDRKRAYFADLGNMEIFDEIAGLVIGRPYGYDEEMRRELARIVEDRCGEREFPVLMNVDI